MASLIFVVDDSRTVIATLRHALNEGGYEVVDAQDGLEGVNVLEKLASEGNKPDMIITDINMPDMDGISFIRKIREKKEYSKTPILVLTTEKNQDLKMEGKNVGANGWLVKPFKSQKLLEIVEDFLK